MGDAYHPQARLLVSLHSRIMASNLTDDEKERGTKIFNLMDADGSGEVNVDEICIVHDSAREQMIKILDADGNNEVSPDEWLNYLAIKKKEKGKKKFAYFMNYLEQEVPKNVEKIAEARAAKAAAAPAKQSAPAPATPAAGGSRQLKEEFRKAVEVFDPPNLGLKDTRIKDAFTNLMFAIQDLDAAVGQGTQPSAN